MRSLTGDRRGISSHRSMGRDAIGGRRLSPQIRLRWTSAQIRSFTWATSAGGWPRSVTRMLEAGGDAETPLKMLPVARKGRRHHRGRGSSAAGTTSRGDGATRGDRGRSYSPPTGCPARVLPLLHWAYIRRYGDYTQEQSFLRREAARHDRV